MPAVARKSAPESHQNYRIVNDERVPVRKSTPAKSAASRNRWHETPPNKSNLSAKRVPAGRSTHRRDQQNETVDLRGLLDHFSGENAARAEHQQKEVEARRTARKRARLCHRPFRLTILATTIAGAPLIILACLLWMRSSALALSREDRALQTKIEATRSELEQTRREIAAVNASSQVEQWAIERGWRRAIQNDFDQVSKVVPVIPADADMENSNAL